ncbi:hypothetical protein MIR68_007661 [Amoeboaphelidium protococcarum]|nr:hypothetical protein MIR68_007661 [Amoeboaphelidium protococcarum]
MSVIRFIVAASALSSVIVSRVVVPTQFCNLIPSGSYCNPSNQRVVINCPESIQTWCPQDSVCVERPLRNGSVATCQKNYKSLAIDSCVGIKIKSSKCLDETTIVECPKANVFKCSAGLKCVKRGFRAYCQTPDLPAGAQVDVCAGYDGKDKPEKQVCDVINLRKIVTCPSGKSSLCRTGFVCSLVNGTAGCVPWAQSMNQFCSNKPLFSSFCVPRDNEIPQEFVECGQIPRVVSCPERARNCVQKNGITSECF